MKAVLLALCVVLMLPACAVNPATGQANMVTMSERRELELGTEEHEKVMSSMPVFRDEALNAYVTEVGQRVAEVSHRPDLEYTFTIIDSPDINAFALPGGYVYINRGLLTFLNSEAQLAAVLAHEIGHITARHAIQRHARGSLGNVAANIGGFVAAVATGSGHVGYELAELGAIWAAAGVSGFGREMELEADSLGAEYLLNAGYNPTAMIDVLAVLKNEEDFNTRIGNSRSNHHGLFSTHPRNDVRLQQAVARAGEFSQEDLRETDPAVFRQNLDGLIVGPSQGSTSNARNRYYQTLLGYTLVFPDEWQINETPTTVAASAPEGEAQLHIEVRRLQQGKEPRLYIRENLGIENLQRSEPLNQYRLQGFTGVHTPEGSEFPERIAVLYLGPRAYIFRGRVNDGEELEELDRLLLSSIRTFRAIQGNEMYPGSELRLRYVQVTENFSWRAVAAQAPIGQYAEETLRLLNGYYPIGNPQPGDWIKILQ